MYDLLIPGIGAFIIICIILLRRQSKGKKDNNARGRTTHSGLMLSRSPREKKAAAKSSSKAGPLILALAVLIIGSWLALSYFNPGPAPDTPVAEAAGGGPEEDSKTLSGRIVMGRDAAPPPAEGGSAMRDAASAAGAAGTVAAQQGAGQELPPATPPPPVSMAQASQGILPTVSRMEQVGLLPAKAAAPRAQKPPAAAKPKSAAAPAASASQKPAAQQAAPKPAPKPAAAAAQDDRPILGGTREFTVHLASFTERGNAEKYMGKLVSAREKDAFITESMVNGRLWYRVMSGRFPSQAAAEAHGNDLRRRNLTASGGRFVIKPLP